MIVFDTLIGVIGEANESAREEAPFESSEAVDAHYRPYFERVKWKCKNDFKIFMYIANLSLTEGDFVAGCLASELTKTDGQKELERKVKNVKDKFGKDSYLSKLLNKTKNETN